MNKKIKEAALKELQKLEGCVGMSYEDLTTSDTFQFNGDTPIYAASVIKLPVFMCIKKWINEGSADGHTLIRIRE